ncbi:hypothetical protein GCM10010424_15980 [Streptomyces lienomycini]
MGRAGTVGRDGPGRRRCAFAFDDVADFASCIQATAPAGLRLTLGAFWSARPAAPLRPPGSPRAGGAEP